MMNKIRLTENDLYKVIKETVSNILTEGVNNIPNRYFLYEDKRTDQAKKRCLDVIRNHFNNASWLDTIFRHQDNPDNLSHLDYMFKQFMDTFYHNQQLRSSNVMRLAPLFCKLAFEANFQNNNPDNNRLQRLNKMLNLIYNMGAQGKIDVSKISLDTTYEQLNDMFGSIIDDLNHQESERIANTTYERNNDYEIIGPIDYETAHKYGEHSCPSSKLCYTQSESTWNRYTSNGNNNVYVCLKNGWETVKPVHDGNDNSQYDTYGLSMIFVFIDGQGDLAYCNTRWNHNGTLPQGYSVDHAMSREMLSEIIGAPFSSVFKPNNRWQTLIDEVKRRLSNGEDPENVFDYVDNFYGGFAKVRLGEKYNYINDSAQILSPDQWFDSVYTFYNGFAIVNSGGKYNHINEKGDIISDQWFDWAYDFDNGFAKVKLNGKYNFINDRGDIIFPDQWLDYADNFRNGFAMVRLGERYNLINDSAQILSKQWFNYVDDFDNGFAMVRLGVKYNYINEKGDIISNQWFDYVDKFDNGFATVKLDGRYNYINDRGQLLFPDQWFDLVYKFSDGVAKVLSDGKFNLINKKRQLLFPGQWFDYINSIDNGFAEVKLNGKYNFINDSGHFLSKQWFDNVGFFHDGFATVKLGEKYNFINEKGDIISNQWFDYADNFRNGFATVRLGVKYNFINDSGQILSKQWFNYVNDFDNGFAMVRFGVKYNFINDSGHVISDQWFDWAYDFSNGFAMVRLDGKYNYINDSGQILSPDQWFDYVDDFYDGFAMVRIGSETYYIDEKGRLCDLKKNLIKNIRTESRDNKGLKLTEKEIKRIVKESINRLLS